MKRIITFILTLSVLAAAMCLCGVTVYANESGVDKSQIISVVRGDFCNGEVPSDFTTSGQYEWGEGLILKGGQVRTQKLARYFLSYLQVRIDGGMAFTIGDNKITIDTNAEQAEGQPTVTFNGDEQIFDRKNWNDDPVLIRVEYLDKRLSVGIRLSSEAVDVIYKDVAVFDYEGQYLQLGVCLPEEGQEQSANSVEILTFKVYPYDSNFTPDHHDYDEIEDATPQRDIKPVRNPKNKDLWLWIGCGGAALAVVAAVIVTVIVVKKKKGRNAQ